MVLGFMKTELIDFNDLPRYKKSIRIDMPFLLLTYLKRKSHAE